MQEMQETDIGCLTTGLTVFCSVEEGSLDKTSRINSSPSQLLKMVHKLWLWEKCHCHCAKVTIPDWISYPETEKEGLRQTDGQAPWQY